MKDQKKTVIQSHHGLEFCFGCDYWMLLISQPVHKYMQQRFDSLPVTI